MDEQEILGRIATLVNEEHDLEGTADHALTDADRARRHHIEIALDQCWDLLRQRRARRSAGLDPDDAQVRPVNVVEGYQQ